jgi:uncharacterized membrane protein YkvA (DUF1232 family)
MQDEPLLCRYDSKSGKSGVTASPTADINASLAKTSKGGSAELESSLIYPLCMENAAETSNRMDASSSFRPTSQGDMHSPRIGRKSVMFNEEVQTSDSEVKGLHQWNRFSFVGHSQSSLKTQGRFDNSLLHASNGNTSEYETRKLSLRERVKAALNSFRGLGREVLALYHALKDPRTPYHARVLPWVVSVTVALGNFNHRKEIDTDFYNHPSCFGQVIMIALSPLALIPDAIPIIGMLDNLVIMPVLIWLAIHVLPDSVSPGISRQS